MSKQLLLGLAVLSVVVVVGFLTLGGSDDPVKVVQQSDSAAAGGAGEERFEARQPGSLKLGAQPGSRAESADQAGRGERAVRSDPSTDGRAPAKPPRFDRAGGGYHQGEQIGGDADVAGSELRSGLQGVEKLAGAARAGTVGGSAGGGTAPRAPADDWPEDAVDVAQPADQREPDEGEILTLFEGEPAVSQAEATIEKDVEIDDDGATFTVDSEYAVPMAGKMSGDAGSISFWVRPNGEMSDVDNASLVQLRSANEWANRLQIWKDGGNVRLVFSDGNGVETGSTYGSESWAPDEWRMVTATWGEGMTALYVNGEPAGTSQYEGGFTIRPDTLLHVGSNYRDDPRSLNGAVNQFRVYNRVLSPSEVASLSSRYPE